MAALPKPARASFLDLVPNYVVFFRISERIRMSVKEVYPVDYLNVTASIGGTFWQGVDRQFDAAMRLVCSLMQTAKRQGRDRIVCDMSLAATRGQCGLGATA